MEETRTYVVHDRGVCLYRSVAGGKAGNRVCLLGQCPNGTRDDSCLHFLVVPIVSYVAGGFSFQPAINRRRAID
jgi:hypothetical protein